MDIKWTILIILGAFSFLISLYYFISGFIRDRRIINDLTSPYIQNQNIVVTNSNQILPVTNGILVQNIENNIIILYPD